MTQHIKLTSLAAFLCFIFISKSVFSQVLTPVSADSVHPADPAWETRFRSRIDELMNVFTFTQCGNGNAGVDDGKNLWPRFLSQLYKERNNPTAVNNLINTCGNSLINSQWAGTICGPFSAPGLSMYYLSYKDLLPQAQKDRVRNYFYEPRNYPFRCPSGNIGWHFVMRPDQQMDPVYNTENPETNPNNKFNGNEKNSENYHWMLRMAGYLMAEDLCDTSNAEDRERLEFFNTWAKNWIRGLYNVGRIEWNSNNYWGHTMQPLLVFHHHAKNPEVKKMAKAGLDWMLTEAALHYMDGFMAAADVRAKVNAYQPFAGSVWGYNYFYFADENHLPSYYRPGVFTGRSVNDFIGYAAFSGYKPPQVVVDIAQRKFDLPVEIRSAKPFYNFDFESYKDWKGNTTRSRRFEFETLWLDKNHLISSAASNIPDGWAECDRQRPFSEQSMWRLAVKGTTNGAIQLYGNSGEWPNAIKRHILREPREQIGQFRNAMMRILKNPDSMWVEAPTTLPVEISGNRLFIDFGNGVFAAFQPHNAATLDTMQVVQAVTQRRYLWKFNTGHSLGALTLETGTDVTYTSFDQFKAQILSNSSFSMPDGNTMVYNGANGHELKMEFQTATEPYIMTTPVTPACTLTTNIGTVPKVWGNNNYIDFETWDSYRVSHGKEIVYQPWGQGFMNLRSNDNGLQIKIDSANATASYFTFDPDIYVTDAKPGFDKSAMFQIVPNPAHGTVEILTNSDFDSVAEIFDLQGKKVRFEVVSKTRGRIKLNIDLLKSGLYQVKLKTKAGIQTQRMLVN